MRSTGRFSSIIRHGVLVTVLRTQAYYVVPDTYITSTVQVGVQSSRDKSRQVACKHSVNYMVRLGWPDAASVILSP